jgi:periplasmic protein TonB
VAFESWTVTAADKVRRNRLIFGYVIGASSVASGIAFVVLTSSANVAAQEEEDAKVVEVQLVKEPEPEPEPPPPELKQHSMASAGPHLPKLAAPTAITNEKVDEKEAKPASAGSADPYEKGGGDGSGAAQKAVVEPVAPPAPAPAPHLNKPRPISEDDAPPELLGADARPEYPAEAKAAGIEGVVLVRYVVTEPGDVKDVKAMKGPPELFAVCVAAVKALRFRPAHDAQGNPISVVRFKKFRMRITT